MLIKLAESRPNSTEALHRIIRGKSSMARRYGDAMLKAIAEAAQDERPLPAAPAKVRSGTPARHGSRETERLLGQLKDWRKEVLSRDKVPMVLVLSNSQLKAVAGFRPRTEDELRSLEELRSWQVERYSTELLTMVHSFEDGLGETKKPRGRRRSRR